MLLFSVFSFVGALFVLSRKPSEGDYEVVDSLSYLKDDHSNNTEESSKISDKVTV